MEKKTAQAIIVAAGDGTRMKGRCRKQFLELGRFPILYYTLVTFLSSDAIDKIILVLPESDTDYCRKQVLSKLDTSKPVTLVPGGKQRQESVYFGLLEAERICSLKPKESKEPGIVVIHDGVRPFVQHSHIRATIDAAMETGACVTGIQPWETVKACSPNGEVRKTLDRNELWLVQTPQAFRLDLILKAHKAARSEGFWGTDDGVLVERKGGRVKMVEGSRSNIKITSPEDMEIAEMILKKFECSNV